MFNLIAVLFLVVNGVQSEEPAGTMRHQQTFKTEAECIAFLHTDAGKASMAAFEGKPLVVKFGCVEAEDNSI